ncbi:AbiV family abortive infection protein [Candidatus Palauibacter sp.]|uniref:AbiV family abortive infection protein n=1 Tax=Candidatus Palauibacter sp. TaxID=3101350 RepID=UPI003B02DAF5
MRRAIADLVQLSDERFFEEISKGIGHVVGHADSLDALADRLADIGEHRGAGIVRALAEEEAAKVLILVDAVRCPLAEAANRSKTLSGFYNHLAKHIYAEACWWRSADFAEVKRAINRERRPYYLDGPNDVDWIFSNSAATDRERSIYVDYVQDITEEDGEYDWFSPIAEDESWRYNQATPMSLVVARALFRVGVTTPSGLSIVADVWRPFRPEPDTRFPELSRIIGETLDRVIENGLCSESDPGPLVRTVIGHWPFPLWSLDLKPAPEPNPQELRKERKAYIRELMEKEAQRDPPPQIQRARVEALSRAYDDWRVEVDQLVNSQRKKDDRIIRPLPMNTRPGQLESYVRLQRMLSELTLEERMDLAALAWFGRERRSGWEFLHAHARSVICDGIIDYECGLGRFWLGGLERWEQPPEVPESLKPSG